MDAKGLSAIDCTDVLTGNADLADSCAWQPPAHTERPGLPGLEHQAGADWDLYDLAFYCLAVVGIYMGVIA